MYRVEIMKNDYHKEAERTCLFCTFLFQGVAGLCRSTITVGWLVPQYYIISWYTQSQRQIIGEPFGDEYLTPSYLLSVSFFPRLKMAMAHSTYICRQSTTVSVPSPEAGLSHPLTRQRVCPTPRNPKGGGSHSPDGEELGESQFRRLEKSLALCLLCGPRFFRPGGM